MSLEVCDQVRLNQPAQLQNSASHEILDITVKFLNFWMPQKLCCNIHKIQKKRINYRVFRIKDANANGIANSADPDQTAPRVANSEDPDQTAPLGAVWRSSLVWVCTVCPDLFIQKLRIITVIRGIILIY